MSSPNQQMNFSNRNLEKIPNINENENVISINFSNNPISTFQNLPSFPNLQVLSIDNTNISSFQYAPKLPSLREFTCLGTSLSSVSPQFLPLMAVMIFGDKLKQVNCIEIKEPDFLLGKAARREYRRYLVEGYVFTKIGPIKLFNPQTKRTRDIYSDLNNFMPVPNKSNNESENSATKNKRRRKSGNSEEDPQSNETPPQYPVKTSKAPRKDDSKNLTFKIETKSPSAKQLKENFVHMSNQIFSNAVGQRSSASKSQPATPETHRRRRHAQSALDNHQEMRNSSSIPNINRRSTEINESDEVRNRQILFENGRFGSSNDLLALQNKTDDISKHYKSTEDTRKLRRQLPVPDKDKAKRKRHSVTIKAPEVPTHSASTDSLPDSQRNNPLDFRQHRKRHRSLKLTEEISKEDQVGDNKKPEGHKRRRSGTENLHSQPQVFNQQMGHRSPPNEQYFSRFNSQPIYPSNTLSLKPAIPPQFEIPPPQYDESPIFPNEEEIKQEMPTVTDEEEEVPFAFEQPQELTNPSNETEQVHHRRHHHHEEKDLQNEQNQQIQQPQEIQNEQKANETLINENEAPNNEPKQEQIPKQEENPETEQIPKQETTPVQEEVPKQEEQQILESQQGTKQEEQQQIVESQQEAKQEQQIVASQQEAKQDEIPKQEEQQIVASQQEAKQDEIPNQEEQQIVASQQETKQEEKIIQQPKEEVKPSTVETTETPIETKKYEIQEETQIENKEVQNENDKKQEEQKEDESEKKDEKNQQSTPPKRMVTINIPHKPTDLMSINENTNPMFLSVNEDDDLEDEISDNCLLSDSDDENEDGHTDRKSNDLIDLELLPEDLSSDDSSRKRKSHQ